MERVQLLATLERHGIEPSLLLQHWLPAALSALAVIAWIWLGVRTLRARAAGNTTHGQGQAERRRTWPLSSSGLGFRPVVWREAQRERVHAVAVSGRGPETIRKHVTEVRTTPRATHFRAHHAERAVVTKLNSFGANCVVERGPTASRIKLRPRTEQLGITTTATVETIAMLAEQLARSRTFGASASKHLKRVRIKARAPLLVGERKLVTHRAKSFAVAGEAGFWQCMRALRNRA